MHAVVRCENNNGFVYDECRERGRERFWGAGCGVRRNVYPPEQAEVVGGLAVSLVRLP